MQFFSKKKLPRKLAPVKISTIKAVKKPIEHKTFYKKRNEIK